LDFAIAIAEVDEDAEAMIAVAIGPTANRNRLTNVAGPEFATGVSS
jgi:hypothetical protein